MWSARHQPRHSHRGCEKFMITGFDRRLVRGSHLLSSEPNQHNPLLRMTAMRSVKWRGNYTKVWGPIS